MKAILRKQAMQCRDNLSLVEKQEKEIRIVDTLLPLLEDKKMIGIYLPKGNEVDISALLFLNKCIGVPKVRNKEAMDFFLIQGYEDVEESIFGLLEPTTNILINVEDLDCILVPLIAFDENKHRIGYGKGYYDRYLKGCSAITIGVAFTCQKVESIPCDEHDIDLDMIVTEQGIYK